MHTYTDDGTFVIGAHNAALHINPVVAGERKSHGLKPRDPLTHPRGCYPWATAVDFPLIPEGEYAQRLKDRTDAGALISQIRMRRGPGGGMIPSRDQNGKGYCWAHSGVTAHLAVRALNNEPYADLSAYAVACIIKDYADEGGWGAQGVDWQLTNGCPTSQFWPQQSMSQSNDNPQMRANAKQNLILGQWADLSTDQSSRNLTWAQVSTLLLSGVPIVTDFNWWSHSVCAIDLIDGTKQWGRTRVGTGKLANLIEFDRIWAIHHPITQGSSLLIWNSWGDSWSNKGMGALTGSHAIPDGAVAPYTVMPSPG